MFEPAARVWRLAGAVACIAGMGALSGCAILTGSTGGSVVDAHVIYRLQPGCDALIARTLRNGYTVMRPLELPAESGYIATSVLEVSGIFEGPVREGESVFRYTPPSSSDTWFGEEKQLVIDVLSVQLELEAALNRLSGVCASDSVSQT